MKKYLTLTLFTALSLLCQTARGQKLFSPLGKPLNLRPECSCIDRKGNLTVGYFRDASNDTLYFEKWNPTTKSWSLISKPVSITKKYFGYSKCIYKNDSLIVFSRLKVGGTFKNGIFYLKNKDVILLGETKMFKSDGFITDMKIIDEKLFVFGQFDSIIANQQNRRKCQNIASFDDDKWEDIKAPVDVKLSQFKDIPVAVINDTVLIATADNIIYSYIYPDKWSKFLISDPSKPFTSITALKNKWLITFANTDTILYVSGKSYELRQIKSKIASQISTCNTRNGVIISEFGKSGRLLRIDPAKGEITTLYVSTLSDSIKRNIISDSLNTYFYSNSPIIHENTQFGNIAQLNLNYASPIAYDTISLFVFNDLNNNFKKDPGEGYLFPSRIFNRTYNREMLSQTGIFKDLIPAYNEAEYEYLSNNNCFTLPFSGNLKSRNTRKGVTHDSLYFPLQNLKTIKNLAIKGYAGSQARLMDTINLNVDIFNKDCINTPSNSDLYVDLAPNTTFLSASIAPASYSSNRLTFNLTNLSPTDGNFITIKVVYPLGKFKIGNLVKHFVTIKPDFTEEVSDNVDSIVQKIVYSYDPNSKNCIPQGEISGDVRVIRYFIEFQNEGNSEARRVTVVDTLNTDFPVYEFQMVAASHPYTVSLRNNVITWVFDNINLPPKAISEKASQGFIIFEAHLNSSISVGDSVTNKAFIFFDYNEPIVTNNASIIRIEDAPVIPEVPDKMSLKVYPNPSNSTITIENQSVSAQNVEVFNMIGQKILDVVIEGKEKLSETVVEWPQGVYILRSTKGGIQKLLVN